MSLRLHPPSYLVPLSRHPMFNYSPMLLAVTFSPRQFPASAPIGPSAPPRATRGISRAEGAISRCRNAADIQENGDCSATGACAVPPPLFFRCRSESSRDS